MKTNINLLASIILPAFFVVTTTIIGTELMRTNAKTIEYSEILPSNKAENEKIQILEKFFEKYNSPLKGSAKTFVEVSAKYGMDYKMLPAISCMESTCGKFMIPDTYNPFGWGIYGNHYISFNSFDEAIEVVGKGINDGYVSKGFDTVEEIAPIYTPPNHRNWSNGVSFFMNKMTEIEQKADSEKVLSNLISMK